MHKSPAKCFLNEEKRKKSGFFQYFICSKRHVHFFSATVATISYTKAHASFKLTVCDHPVQ